MRAHACALVFCCRACDLEREVDAVCRSSAEVKEALRVAQEDSRTTLLTIEQLQAELKLTKNDFAACQKRLEAARSESNTQLKEVEKCRAEHNSAIAKAEAAQRDATEKTGQIRQLELQLEAEQARLSSIAARGAGDTQENAGRNAIRRHNRTHPKSSSLAQSQAQLHQQPGLVITPEALNWYVPNRFE